MPEPKIEIKKLDIDDIGWIMEYAHEYTSLKNIEESFKYVNLSVATRIDGVVKSIIIMIVGEDKSYVTLLWTDRSYWAIKEAMIFLRNLSVTSTVLFDINVPILHNHRCEIRGEKSGRMYYKMVV